MAHRAASSGTKRRSCTGFTSLGDLAALRPVPWYATALFYLLVAVVAAMVGLLRQ
jgi:hypothetical protein